MDPDTQPLTIHTPEAQKAQSLNFKTTKELRTLIETSAIAHKRSLTEEIERRIYSSFGVPAHNVDDEKVRLFRQISVLIDIIELKSGHEWTSDLSSFYAVRAGIIDLIDRKFPAGAFSQQNQSEELWKSIGVDTARFIKPLSY